MIRALRAVAPRGRARILWQGCGVLLLYLAAAMLLLGRHALADPSHVCACIGSGDPPTYMWALRWWPHALSHGLNPFFTHLA